MPVEKKRIAIVLIAMFIYVLMSVVFCYGSEVKVIKGVIQDVLHDSIKVNGKYYDIYGVPIKDAQGKSVSKERLRTGKRVSIFFQGSSITTILLDESMID